MNPDFASAKRARATNSDLSRSGWARFFGAFRNAFRGLAVCTVTERNMRIHTAAAAAVQAFCLIFRPPLGAVAAGVAASAVVLAAELMNCAVEAAVDLAVGDTFSGQARLAKDAAAGAVLTLAAASLAVAAWIVRQASPLHWQLFSRAHLAGALLSLLLLLALVVVVAQGLTVRRRERRSLGGAQDRR